jgi:hypothetical protein
VQQLRYWNYLVQTVGHSRYLQYYKEYCDDIERRIAIVAAVTSSASIAGWAIWQHLSWLWACIIASSQVLGAVRSYLPYARMAETLRETTPAFKSLAMRIEARWFRVADGSFSDEEIHDLIMEFQKEQLDIEDKMFAKITLKRRPDLLALAEQDTLHYINLYYEQSNNPGRAE